MIAFCSYVLETAVRSQRGIAPLIAYALVMTVLGTSQPFTLDSVAISATVLFPLAAWTGYCAHTWEAPDQQLVSAAALGSLTLARVLRTAVAAALAAVVSCACVVLPSLLSSWSALDLALGQLAVASIAIVGAAAGTFVASATGDRPGLAAAVLGAVAILDVVVPHAPPVRTWIDVLTHDPGATTATIVNTVAATVATGAVLLCASLLLERALD